MNDNSNKCNRILKNVAWRAMWAFEFQKKTAANRKKQAMVAHARIIIDLEKA